MGLYKVRFICAIVFFFLINFMTGISCQALEHKTISELTERLRNSRIIDTPTVTIDAITYHTINRGNEIRTLTKNLIMPSPRESAHSVSVSTITPKFACLTIAAFHDLIINTTPLHFKEVSARALILARSIKMKLRVACS